MPTAQPRALQWMEAARQGLAGNALRPGAGWGRNHEYSFLGFGPKYLSEWQFLVR